MQRRLQFKLKSRLPIQPEFIQPAFSFQHPFETCPVGLKCLSAACCATASLSAQ